jgi:type I restriction enzyme S subunit
VTTTATTNNGHTLSTNVPSHWKIVSLGDVLTDIIGGGTPSKTNPSYWKGSIPWLSIKDMRTRRPADAIDHISEEAVQYSSTNIIPADTVIIATRVGLGKVVRVPYDSAINQDLKALIVGPELDKSYLEYWMTSIANYLESIGSGTTVKGIRLEQLRSIPFPLAPLKEQKLIVAEIEKQFSRLDDAVANLKRVKANLKRYKAAVLKAAVEGKLTEEWRKAHPDVEPASELLKRILADRREKWEKAELAKMKTQGKKPKDDKWKKNYQEPELFTSTVEVRDLPKGWVWVTVAQIGSIGEQSVLTGPFGSNMGKADFQSHGIPVLTIGCLKEEGIFLGNAAYVTRKKADELERYKLKEGDLLFSRMAAVGRAGYVTQELVGTIFNYHIMRLRLSKEAVDPHYFMSYIRGAKAVTDYVREVNHGATRDGINTGQLLTMPVALPPFMEQQQIVQEVDLKLSLVREVEKDVETNLIRAERLRKAILEKAFAGNLVI